MNTRQAAYAAVQLPAIVLAFFDGMEVALAAASLAISRSGASALAELAAMRVPAVLVPFPAAADNHQWHNAHHFEQTGAGRLLDQKLATPEVLTRRVGEFLNEPAACERAKHALALWHKPGVAADIAEAILKRIAEKNDRAVRITHKAGNCSCACHSTVGS